MDNVLIADGDAQLLETLKNGLNRLRQFNVHVAGDMDSAVAALSAHRIAVLVTSLTSEAFDSLSLLSYMSRNHPITPCIVMTGRGKPWFKSRLGQQSFLYYQEKPFQIGTLASSVIVGLNLCDLGTNIEGMTLVSLLPLMAMLGGTCRLTVSTDDKQAGEMYFKDGVLFDARCNGQDGEPAARRMAVWNRIAFEISGFPDNTPRRIETDLMEIADASWKKEDAITKKETRVMHQVAGDDVLVLEDVVTGNEDDAAEEEAQEAITLWEEISVPPDPDTTDSVTREVAQRMMHRLAMDIRRVKGYQAAAVFTVNGDLLATDRNVENLDLSRLAAEMPRFCNDAQAAADRMQLDAADAFTLHTRSSILLLQKFVSETGTPLCALIVCSPQGNWYYFKVRLENLVRVAVPAN